MIDIQHTANRGARLVSTRVVSPSDFADIAQRMDGGRFGARQIGLISARTALVQERVETRWNGQETTNVARPGDRIVTSLTAAGRPLLDREGHANVYVIKADKFIVLYEIADTIPSVGLTYRARGVVEAIDFPGGFDIMAPWGERQTADSGFLILNGSEVYGNNADTFEAGYMRLSA